MTADEIVKEITRRAWSFGVAVLLAPAESVKNGNIRSGGWFDGDSAQPVLATAASGDPSSWIGTLLHEYCHLTQWAEGAPIWKGADGWGKVGPWLDGKQVRGVEAAIADVRELEADCERRTVRLIREMNAPVDLDEYIRAANSYVHFYNVMAETRKWYAEGRGPYSVPEVLAAANPTLDADFRKTPAKLRKLLLTCV
ncbi:hypothetical protein ACFQZQ_03005 [Lysobacter koreensis]|uniref:Uncharacterized protein n=1 Tax=Lysobacter koreensis TaxID=266122 RepID=A0ABW2YJ16_9GAMM